MYRYRNSKGMKSNRALHDFAVKYPREMVAFYTPPRQGGDRSCVKRGCMGDRDPSSHDDNKKAKIWTFGPIHAESEVWLIIFGVLLTINAVGLPTIDQYIASRSASWAALTTSTRLILPLGRSRRLGLQCDGLNYWTSDHGKQFKAMMTALMPHWRELEQASRHSIERQTERGGEGS